MDLEEFTKALPKIELHAHLNGSLSEKTLIELGCQEVTHYQQQPNRTLEDCFKLFKVAHDGTKTMHSVYTSTKHVIEEFYNDNVIYLELRTTPRAENNMTKEEYIETVVRAIDDNKQKIIVKLILSINREHDFSTSKHALDIIIQMSAKYPNIIKGVDLCGNPNHGEFYAELFKFARAQGLFLTLHCAEICNKPEIKSMLNELPDRIGHGCFLHPSAGGCEKIWNFYLKSKIPIEICLTSNVLCQTVNSYKEHHLGEMIKAKIPFSLSTDDKGVFSTTSSEEHLHAARTFQLSMFDLWNVSYNAVDQTFASSQEKAELKSLLQEWKKLHL